MHSWLGMINWLQLCTAGHLEATKYVGQYILSTAVLGLKISSNYNSTLEAFLNFPLQDSGDPSSSPTLTNFFDDNWGPLDASCPSMTSLHPVSIEESHFTYGHIFIYGGFPILCRTHEESLLVAVLAK
jgi:hypothetical protein